MVAALALGACNMPPQGPEDIYDPFETANRRVHAVNKGVDSLVLRPVSIAYGAVVPEPLKKGVANASANLGVPNDAVNHLLQGDPGASVRMTGRFLVNTTFGVAGLFDPATKFGLPAEDTDFGETLAAWGAQEGPYIEAPLFGPSTARSLTGRAVDIVLDPFSYVAATDAADALLAARVLGRIDSRDRYADFIDPTLYESADSYAAAKVAYMQNRRRLLKGEIDVTDLEDPFAFDE